MHHSMITTYLDNNGFNGHILLEPNLSLGWRSNIKILLLFSVLNLSLAIYFSIAGKWLVLPFSVIELTAFYIALHILFRRFHRCEIVYFTLDSIIIETGKNSAESREIYKRLWSKFYIEQNNKHALASIFIRNHNKTTEIGSFLNYRDKLKTIKTIKQMTSAFRKSALQ